MENTEFDRKDLKIQALLERVSNITTQYENQVADLRVELTYVSQRLQQLEAGKQEAANDQDSADVEEKPKSKK